MSWSGGGGSRGVEGVVELSSLELAEAKAFCHVTASFPP
jgi:hypothetical protein